MLLLHFNCWRPHLSASKKWYEATSSLHVERGRQCAAPEMFFNCLPRKITSVTAHLRNSPKNVVFFFPSKNCWLKIVTKEQGHHYGVVVLDKQDLTLQPSRTKLVSWKRSPSLSWQPGLPKLVDRTQSYVCLSHTLSHCRKANMIRSWVLWIQSQWAVLSPMFVPSWKCILWIHCSPMDTRGWPRHLL